MPKISIIVPVYNTAEYLPKCMNSLINQTFKDIQIILVDDGSQDNSLQICKDFATKDPRITVISQQNQGPSAARNKALKLATGEFIGFLDSDDYIEKNTFETALKYFDDDIDLVIWGVNVVSSDNVPYISWFQDVYFSLKNLGKTKLTDDIKFQTAVVPWNKLYKKSIIFENNITFPEGKLYEDNAFWWKYTMFCNNVWFLNEKFSYYNMRRTSLRGNVINNKNDKETDRIYMVEDVFDFCKKQNLLTKRNKILIEKLFIDSFINAYKEAFNKDAIIIRAQKLLKKLNLGKSENKIIRELKIKKLPNYNFKQKNNFINKEQYIKEIKKTVKTAKSNISELSDLRIASENIQKASALSEEFLHNYLETNSLSEEAKFLNQFTKRLPAYPQIPYTKTNIDTVFDFIYKLYKNNLADEVLYFASIMQIIFPQCPDFNRIKGDVYWFLKKDAIKAFYFYYLYSKIIKDNESVYKTMADICKSQGDIFNEVFYTQLALNSQ